jgi:hypothetical protein
MKYIAKPIGRMSEDELWELSFGRDFKRLKKDYGKTGRVLELIAKIGSDSFEVEIDRVNDMVTVDVQGMGFGYEISDFLERYTISEV